VFAARGFWHNGRMPAVATPASALERFSLATRRWFAETFEGPTRAQELGWDAISRGEHTLLLAPTGSGKTLAAFLWALDQLASRPGRPPEPVHAGGRRTRPTPRAGITTLYISPLKALSYDVERNLRSPLAGLRIAAAREGLPLPDITVGTRTGDTPQKERADIRRNPPDILITTPESLYLMLTSLSREALRTVTTVIVDEIHVMAGTKRGAHLALSIERLEQLTGKPFQRIGLSATQRPLEEIAKYLGGDRPVAVCDAGAKRDLDLQVIVPLDDMTRPGDNPIVHEATPDGRNIESRTSVWPAIYPELLKLIRAHRSTLLFVNNRRLAERLAARLNEIAGEELVRAHHGSVSREQRTQIEEQLKSGMLPALACTSSLELGIDMGAVDLVIQVESPKSVARGLQRVGRSGHHVGGVSSGRIFPKFRGDLLECATLTERMKLGLIEKTDIPRNPLDVLAQQIVAMCAMDDWAIADLEALVRRAYSFAGLSRDVLEGVLGMLAGQYPSDEFADLRPRITWDRATDVLSGRRDAKTIAVVNAGTIPDRGLYGVFLGDGGPRVGELDEEMVYESRTGETFLLGATTWRIEQITRDRVIVSPAPGEPGKMPFWKGDGIGRPLEFGRAIGAFTRELDAMRSPAEQTKRLRERHHLDERAASNLLAYLADEKEATGALPTDRTVTIQRFRDELGDWRVVLLTPFGGRVHSPWSLALEARLAERSGFDVQTLWSDDGIALRFANGEEPPGDEILFPSPEEVEDLVVGQLANSALFAAHFRENAARALLLPRRRPNARMPLWAQRQRSAGLLAVASRYGSFPIILETYRDCLRDVFDLPGLIEVLTDIRSRATRVVSCEVQGASPFARSLLFDYVAAYMYEGDAPLAERRAQALTLDRNLLRDLLGEDELRELLDPDALIETELELQRLADNRKVRHIDDLHDLLRTVGDLNIAELEQRMREPQFAFEWLVALEATHRACRMRIAGEERWIAIEDAGRYRDAIGASPPVGVPEAFLRPTEDPLTGLVGRFARTHAPFVAADPARRWALPDAMVIDALRELEARGTVLHGEFRPGGSEREWCDADVLRMLRRRSLAKLRRDVEPVDHATFARFLAKWQGVGSSARGTDRLREVVAQLEGVALPASALEQDIIAPRIANYSSRQLDELGAAGELSWLGRGTLGKDDGRVALYRREKLAGIALPPTVLAERSAVHEAILAILEQRGAVFFAELVGATKESVANTLAALWELVWAGQVTNDTMAPLRALAWPKRATTGSPRGRGSPIPPEAAGRWSLARDTAAAPTVRAHALAQSLLERYGVVTRETVNAEGIPGGFAAVYPVLKAMEEGGRIRRGYFIDGLGGAQFALPGAVDRLRAEREPGDAPAVHLLAATDPANPYGAAIPWPRRDGDERRVPQRAAGAYLALVDGYAVLYIERGGKSVVTLPGFDDEEAGALAIGALSVLAERSPRGVLTLERIDGAPAGETSWIDRFKAAGFVTGYRGLTLRAPQEFRRAGG
jgi:ATP-dependent Lhr-like helicase